MNKETHVCERRERAGFLVNEGPPVLSVPTSCLHHIFNQSALTSILIHSTGALFTLTCLHKIALIEIQIMRRADWLKLGQKTKSKDLSVWFKTARGMSHKTTPFVKSPCCTLLISSIPRE